MAPKAHPLRTTLGVVTIAFYGILFVTGSNDVIAKWLRADVGDITVVLRWLLFIVPVLAGAVTFILLRALVKSGAKRLTDMPMAAIPLGWQK